MQEEGNTNDFFIKLNPYYSEEDDLLNQNVALSVEEVLQGLNGILENRKKHTR